MSEPTYEKMSPEEFLSKIEWEGGISGAMEYGLSSGELDDSDPELKEAWEKLEELYEAGSSARTVICKKLEALQSSDDEDDDFEEEDEDNIPY